MTTKFQYRAICQLCGMKRYNWEIRKRWDGLLVCGDTCWETRNILDFYRPRNDVHQLPFTSPEPTDTFLRAAGFALECKGQQNATVDSPSASNIVTTFPITVEAMVFLDPKLVVTGAGARNIMRWMGGGSIFRVNGRTLQLYYTTAGTTYQMDSTADIITTAMMGRWVRISGVIANAATAIFTMHYLDDNGTFTSVYDSGTTIVAFGALLTYTGPLVLGCTVGLPEYAPGLIDDIRVWNTARNLAQIQATWNHVLPATTTGLVSNWRFDDLTTTPLSTTTSDSVISQSATINGAQPYPHMMQQGT